MSTCLGVFKHKIFWIQKIEAYYVDYHLEKCLWLMVSMARSSRMLRRVVCCYTEKEDDGIDANGRPSQFHRETTPRTSVHFGCLLPVPSGILPPVWPGSTITSLSGLPESGKGRYIWEWCAGEKVFKDLVLPWVGRSICPAERRGRVIERLFLTLACSCCAWHRSWVRAPGIGE